MKQYINYKYTYQDEIRLKEKFKLESVEKWKLFHCMRNVNQKVQPKFWYKIEKTYMELIITLGEEADDLEELASDKGDIEEQFCYECIFQDLLLQLYEATFRKIEKKEGISVVNVNFPDLTDESEQIAGIKKAESNSNDASCEGSIQRDFIEETDVIQTKYHSFIPSKTVYIRAEIRNNQTKRREENMENGYENKESEKGEGCSKLKKGDIENEMCKKCQKKCWRGGIESSTK